MLKYENQLAKLADNPYGLQYVAKKLGEKPDWVLDMIDEAKSFGQEGKIALKDTKIKRDFAKAEKWIVNNGRN